MWFDDASLRPGPRLCVVRLAWHPQGNEPSDAIPRGSKLASFRRV
jgi:hypothetical protein